MVNTVNFNIYYCYSEQLSELVLIKIMIFPRILIFGSKCTDISVRNTEHNFTRLEALTVMSLCIHTQVYWLYEARRIRSRFGPLFGVMLGVLQTGTLSVGYIHFCLQMIQS